MSNVLYAKITKERRTQFQISTKIILQDGKKAVVKEPLHEEGKIHIRKMYDYYKLYQSNKIKPVSCKVEDDIIYFPFLEGKTLCDLLLNELKKDHIDRANNLLLEYKNIIYGMGQEQQPFKVSPEFEKVFGKTEGLEEVLAGRYINVDNILENIILQNGQYEIIDYEWFFDFYLPYNFVLYRAVLDLYINYNDIMKRLGNFESILQGLGVLSSEITQYHSMNESFNDYVFDNDNGYNRVKQQYKKNILSVDKYASDSGVYAQLYYDDGSGFSEEKSMVQSISIFEYCERNMCRLTWNFTDDHNIARLRFDPINCSGYIQIVSLKAFDRERREIPLEIVKTNSQQVGTDMGRVYLTNDPQVIIHLKKEGLCRFCVEMRVNPYVGEQVNDQTQRINNYIERLKHNNQELQKYINSIVENGNTNE